MKIYTPNKEYTGIKAGVLFENGVAEVTDQRLIETFRRKGYKVEEPKVEEKKPQPKRVKKQED